LLWFKADSGRAEKAACQFLPAIDQSSQRKVKMGWELVE
jgi:hypothetical protein